MSVKAVITAYEKMRKGSVLSVDCDVVVITQDAVPDSVKKNILEGGEPCRTV